jgi:glutamate racemase
MSDAVPPIGVFDSGIGGLSVLREVAALLLTSPLVYVADTAYVPYGARSPEFIRTRSVAIARFLIEAEQSATVVVACNTATTHAVDALRALFTHVPIVGMEPAIKPAAAATRSGVVGVLATAATIGGERFVSLVQRYTDGLELLTQPCPGLVEQVEAGDLDGPATVRLLRTYTAPMLARGADTIVLGCTHYPFLRPALQRLVGPDVTIIDTGAAVARQVQRLHTAAGAPASPAAAPAASATAAASTGAGAATPTTATVTNRRARFFTSGDPDAMQGALERLWGPGPYEVHRMAR